MAAAPKRWARFQSQGGLAGFGILEGDRITEYSGDMFAEPRPTGKIIELDACTLLAPCTPTKMIALWNNFRALAAKLGKQAPVHPLFLIKPATCIIGPNEAIVRPTGYTGKIAYEGELGIVIGGRCKDVPQERASRFIFGYTCVNDVSARDFQRKDNQWTRGKGFDTFCPVGPCMVPRDEVDLNKLRVRTFLNGEKKQDAPITDMLFDLNVIIEYVSAFMTLEPGDLIATGTPSGVGPLQPGSNIRIDIEGVGVLENTVIAEG